MIDILNYVEQNFYQIVKQAQKNNLLKSKYIDYHDPVVERIWFPYKEYRIYFHKIHPCNTEPLFHPHPWKSAVRIVNGHYEMGIGHSETNIAPQPDCIVNLHIHNVYEMLNKDGWHYVKPIDKPVYSLMITGERFDREMPVEPHKDFRELTKEEFDLLFNVITQYYYGEG